MYEAKQNKEKVSRRIDNTMIQRKSHLFNSRGTINIDTSKYEDKNLGVLGLTGIISYTPEPEANDADPIKLIQVVNATDLHSNTPVNWSGDEQRRNKTRTDAGWFLDHSAKVLKPRKTTEDERVPDAYIDSFGFQEAPNCQHGKKEKDVIVPAMMHDNPHSSVPYKFQAEVQVKGKESGEEKIYGHVKWGFESEQKENGLHMKEIYDPSFQDEASNDFNEAWTKFNDVYRNPESIYSPESMEKLRPKTEEDWEEYRRRCAKIFDNNN